MKVKSADTQGGKLLDLEKDLKKQAEPDGGLKDQYDSKFLVYEIIFQTENIRGDIQEIVLGR